MSFPKVSWLFLLLLLCARSQTAMSSHVSVTGQASATNLSNVSISSVTARDITSSSATITWTTDQVATAQVEYGTTTSYGNTTSLDTGLATSHSEAIVRLSSSTLYHFRVHSKDTNGNGMVSGDNTFTTLIAGILSLGWTQLAGPSLASSGACRPSL